MVGSLLMLKILHCARSRKRARGPKSSCPSSSQNDPSYSFTAAATNIKHESNEDNICRICLKEGTVPIYGSEDLSSEVRSFGDIDISFDDCFPKCLCQSCNSLLQGAILFRRTAHQSDQLLRGSKASSIASDNDNYLDMDYAPDDTDYGYEEQYGYEMPNLKCEEKEKGPEKAKKASSNSYYYCKKCDIKFNTFNELSEHRISEEHDSRKVECNICKKFYVSAYMKKHMLLHSKKASYMCDICGKKFAIQGHFTRHRKTHFYELPFKCSLCPYRGRFTESLKMHMRTHTGEKPYQCPQCPSRFFVTKSNLNKHMHTHKEEHEFKCTQCQRGFHTKWNLDIHFKVDHSGIKDHLCNICGKAFGYRKQMMKHQLKVHKREKLKSGRTPLYILVDSKKELEQTD